MPSTLTGIPARPVNLNNIQLLQVGKKTPSLHDVDITPVVTLRPKSSSLDFWKQFACTMALVQAFQCFGVVRRWWFLARAKPLHLSTQHELHGSLGQDNHLKFCNFLLQAQLHLMQCHWDQVHRSGKVPCVWDRCRNLPELMSLGVLQLNLVVALGTFVSSIEMVVALVVALTRLRWLHNS